jgi:hypothetical protein
LRLLRGGRLGTGLLLSCGAGRALARCAFLILLLRLLRGRRLSPFGAGRALIPRSGTPHGASLAIVLLGLLRRRRLSFLGAGLALVLRSGTARCASLPIVLLRLSALRLPSLLLILPTAFGPTSRFAVALPLSHGLIA